MKIRFHNYDQIFFDKCIIGTLTSKGFTRLKIIEVASSLLCNHYKHYSCTESIYENYFSQGIRTLIQHMNENQVARFTKDPHSNATALPTHTSQSLE